MRSFLKFLAKRILSDARFLCMALQFVYMFFPSRKIRVFNLDLHTGLIADLREGFKNLGVRVISWNLSGNNRNFRKIFKIKDPVYPFTGRLWTDYEDSDLMKFRDRYKFFLSRFDGFIACFPPAFAEIFVDFGKPILINVGIRYEAPYTRKPTRWDALNETLKNGVSSGQISIIANNQGDADYLNHFTGILPEVLPSLCDYTNVEWQGGEGVNILFCRNGQLAKRIVQDSEGRMVLGSEYLGKNWNYKNLIHLNSVTVIPYTISTMSLFELATAGVPVRIPSASLIIQLFSEYPDTLNEVSFLGAWGLEFSPGEDDELNNYRNIQTLEWWLERADFYQPDLMPNVQICSTLSELSSAFSPPQNPEEYMELIATRNSIISRDRGEVLNLFLIKLRNLKIAPAKVD